MNVIHVRCLILIFRLLLKILLRTDGIESSRDLGLDTIEMINYLKAYERGIS